MWARGEGGLSPSGALRRRRDRPPPLASDLWGGDTVCVLGPSPAPPRPRPGPRRLGYGALARDGLSPTSVTCPPRAGGARRRGRCRRCHVLPGSPSGRASCSLSLTWASLYSPDLRGPLLSPLPFPLPASLRSVLPRLVIPHRPPALAALALGFGRPRLSALKDEANGRIRKQSIVVSSPTFPQRRGETRPGCDLFK